MKNGTGILPVGPRGIGILPMIHGLEAHATAGGKLLHHRLLAVIMAASEPGKGGLCTWLPKVG
jgi:hypothetical protein